MIYYIFFMLAICYFLGVARTYLNIYRAGNAHMLLKDGAVPFGLDLVILVASLANIVMAVREYLGMNHEHLSSMAVWALFAAVAVHRLTEDIEAIEARMNAKEDRV